MAITGSHTLSTKGKKMAAPKLMIKGKLRIRLRAALTEISRLEARDGKVPEDLIDLEDITGTRITWDPTDEGVAASFAGVRERLEYLLAKKV